MDLQAAAIELARQRMIERSTTDPVAFLRLSGWLDEETEAQRKERLLYYTESEADYAQAPTFYLMPRHQRALIDIIMAALDGTLMHPVTGLPCKRIAISVPPRHGKSQTLVGLGCFLTANRHKTNAMYLTYSDDQAGTWGIGAGSILEEVLARQNSKVKPDRANWNRNERRLSNGSSFYFQGLGGGVTGKGADLIIVDDPIKGDRESLMPNNLNALEKDFHSVAETRLDTEDGVVVVVHTRWLEDDLIGRLTDEDSSTHDDYIYHNWLALIETEEDAEADYFHRNVGETLWPKPFNKARKGYGPAYFLTKKKHDPGNFFTLYQGVPQPSEGNEFRPQDIVLYDKMPEDDLIWYMASDHASSIKNWADYTVIIPFGVDSYGDAYISPHIYWDRAPFDVQAKRIIEFFNDPAHPCRRWGTASGMTFNSLWPLIKRTQEELGTFVRVKKFPETGDKVARSGAARGFMRSGRIRFPAKAPWLKRAIQEILKFDGERSTRTKKDDFVDTLSLIGFMMKNLSKGEKPVVPEKELDYLTKSVMNDTGVLKSPAVPSLAEDYVDLNYGDTDVGW